MEGRGLIYWIDIIVLLLLTGILGNFIQVIDDAVNPLDYRTLCIRVELPVLWK